MAEWTQDASVQAREPLGERTNRAGTGEARNGMTGRVGSRGMEAPGLDLEPWLWQYVHGWQCTEAGSSSQ